MDVVNTISPCQHGQKRSKPVNKKGNNGQEWSIWSKTVKIGKTGKKKKKKMVKTVEKCQKRSEMVRNGQKL